MPEARQDRVDGIAYREAVPAGGGSQADLPVALLVHGYPTSSYLWRGVLPAVAEAGYRAVALDLPGFGDSPADLPGTWERHVEGLDRFVRRGLGLDHVALVLHDWGGLIGLRWACDNPGVATALVLSDTGFFPDGKWHGMAKALRTEGQGEEVLASITRELFGQALRQVSPALSDETLDEFWKAYADDDRKLSQLDLYRSGDFSKLAAYRGKLTELGVPALMLWGEGDEFAPVAGAYRFRKELPDSRIVVIESSGHFVQEDAPGRYANEVRDFLAEVRNRA